MGNFMAWGVVGALSAAAAAAVFWSIWATPERLRKRRAARNQKWVRDKCRANGMDVEAEAKLVAAFRQQIEEVSVGHRTV